MAICYINPTNGSDARSKATAQTYATPWATLQRAADQAAAGDFMVMQDSTYLYDGDPETYPTLLSITGTAGSPITFQAENRGGAILDGNGNAYAMFAFYPNVAYIKIDGFKITRCFWYGIDANAGAGQPHHITISHNEFYNIRRDYSSDSGICGYYTGPGAHDHTFDSNLFHDIGRTTDVKDHHDQILYLYGYNHTIINNIFYPSSDGWSGFCVIFGDGDVDSGFRVINNTFVGNGRLPENNDPFEGPIRISTPVTDTIISDNIVIGTGSYPYTALIDCHLGSQSLGSVIARNNIINGNSVVGVLSTWDETGLTDSNNTLNATDMKFVNAAGHDYHLQSDSPAVNSAYTADLPAYDFDDVARPQSTNGDVGAYEYVNEITRTYSRGSYGSLPADDTDLTTLYSTQDYLDVADDDGTRVGESGNGYILHQFKDIAGASDTKVDLHCNLQAPLAPADYPVYLQCLDRVTAGGMWVTVVTDNSSSANTDFDMDFTLDSGTTPTFDNCKDGDGVISSRVYQTNVPLS